MNKKLLLRSMMFVPGHNDKLLTSAVKSKADALILDLEDSVQPCDNKKIARDNIEKKVNEGFFTNQYIFVRINDRESGFLLKDIYQLAIDGITGFVYPKAYTASDIYFIDKLLETIEYEKKFPIGHFKIIPLIETTSAVLNADQICKSSKRVIALAFGCEDYVSDLNGIHDSEGVSIFTARSLIAIAAQANKIVPVDTVNIHVHDLDRLEKNLKIAKKLGFEGMLVLHPKELDLVHKYFSPDEEEVRDAEEMLRLYEEAQKENKGVAVKNGKFIGPPMVVAAKKLLEKNKIISLKN